jgi:hypothetical protein
MNPISTAHGMTIKNQMEEVLFSEQTATEAGVERIPVRVTLSKGK